MSMTLCDTGPRFETGSDGGAEVQVRTARRERRERPPWRFFLRWAAAVAVSLVLASLVMYALTSRGLERRLLQESLHGYTAQATSLEDVLARESTATPSSSLRSEVNWISRGYGTTYAGLYDSSGRRITASGERHGGIDVATLRTVIDTGRPLLPDAQTTGSTGQRRFEFLLPVRSSRGTAVLVVDSDPAILTNLVFDLRLRQARSLLLVILIAAPVSYLLGGRGLHRRQRAAERTADTDALTGIYGRRRFESTLQEALAAPADDAVALALIDIDNFKRVNDRFGHSHGDQVLIALARSFDALRDSDFAFRMGGDEFAVILPQADEQRATQVLARVRAALTHAIPDVTISCGIASVRVRDRVEQQELWERADSALYEAKRLGRHQTVTFSTVASGVTRAVTRLEEVAQSAAETTRLPPTGTS